MRLTIMGPWIQSQSTVPHYYIGLHVGLIRHRLHVASDLKNKNKMSLKSTADGGKYINGYFN